MPKIAPLGPGDVVRLRKPHPCGGWEWEVLRAGHDVKLKCTTCSRSVTLPRAQVTRRLRSITPRTRDP